MVKSVWNAHSQRVSALGGRLGDTDLRTQKTVLLFLSLSAVPIGIIWTLIEVAVGEPRNGAITGLIAALVLFNMLVYIYRGNYPRFRISQLIIFLSFPFVLHLAVGGFTKSANLIWGLATPLIALLSSRPREGTPWFIAFLLLVAIAGIIDPLLFPASNMSVSASFFEFSFNIINISLIVYLMILYFVRRKNRAYRLLAAERRKSERLLLNVLPREIAPALKSGNEIIADHFESASILFADIVGFTRLSMQMTPGEMVALLNDIFSQFDSMVEKHHLEKIRTIGDNYMVAAGVPRPRADHAHALAHLALEMAAYVKALPPRNGAQLRFRIGMNSGPVVAGVIGRHKFQYDVWGDAVNTASRMESQGVAGKIQITAAMHALIQDQFDCVPRGIVDIKGKGMMDTWYLLSGRDEGPRHPH